MRRTVVEMVAGVLWAQLLVGQLALVADGSPVGRVAGLVASGALIGLVVVPRGWWERMR